MRMRGQAATEYLIILAVVVIIALIVVGVLGGFPRLTSGVTRAESDAYWSTADIAIIGASLNATGEGNILIRNNKVFDININEIGIGTPSAAPISVSPSRISSGQTATLKVGEESYVSGNSGEEYSLIVIIRYGDAAHPELNYTFTGVYPLIGNYQ